MRCRGSGRERSTYSNTRKFIKKDKEGVASVVGTIMALLIFLTILTIFVNTWMPVILKENERNHMDEVMNEFGTMKGGVDNMIVYTSLTGYSSSTIYQSIDLGAEGIPAFASATAGLLRLNPAGSTNSRSYANFSVSSVAKTLSSGGSVEFYAPNRYYVEQWLAYENGAIILKQEDGQIVRATPGITFTVDSGALNVNYYQISLYGQSTSTAGTENTGLNMQVLAVEKGTYNPDAYTTTPTAQNDVTFTFITKYGQAYYDYLNNTLSGMTGMVNTGIWTYSSADSFSYQNTEYSNTASAFWKVSYSYLEQYDCYAITLTTHNAQNKVSSITYSHAYVNYEIAQ
jgi:hypothetical protein